MLIIMILILRMCIYFNEYIREEREQKKILIIAFKLQNYKQYASIQFRMHEHMQIQTHFAIILICAFGERDNQPCEYLICIFLKKCVDMICCSPLNSNEKKSAIAFFFSSSKWTVTPFSTTASCI